MCMQGFFNNPSFESDVICENLCRNHHYKIEMEMIANHSIYFIKPGNTEDK